MVDEEEIKNVEYYIKVIEPNSSLYDVDQVFKAIRPILGKKVIRVLREGKDKNKENLQIFLAVCSFVERLGKKIENIDKENVTIFLAMLRFLYRMDKYPLPSGTGEFDDQDPFIIVLMMI